MGRQATDALEATIRALRAIPTRACPSPEAELEKAENRHRKLESGDDLRLRLALQFQLSARQRCRFQTTVNSRLGLTSWQVHPQARTSAVGNMTFSRPLNAPSISRTDQHCLHPHADAQHFLNTLNYVVAETRLEPIVRTLGGWSSGGDDVRGPHDSHGDEGKPTVTTGPVQANTGAKSVGLPTSSRLAYLGVKLGRGAESESVAEGCDQSQPQEGQQTKYSFGART
jgi:hypothetical protein